MSFIAMLQPQIIHYPTDYQNLISRACFSLFLIKSTSLLYIFLLYRDFNAIHFEPFSLQYSQLLKLHYHLLSLFCQKPPSFISYVVVFEYSYAHVVVGEGIGRGVEMCNCRLQGVNNINCQQQKKQQLTTAPPPSPFNFIQTTTPFIILSQ